MQIKFYEAYNCPKSHYKFKVIFSILNIWKFNYSSTFGMMIFLLWQLRTKSNISQLVDPKRALAFV